MTVFQQVEINLSTIQGLKLVPYASNHASTLTYDGSASENFVEIVEAGIFIL
jgi:hypothetical protein